MKTLDAVEAPLDGGLIEASAGTGKTYTITTLFLRLLLERELNVGEILVVTFTTAATAELRERIRSRLREALAAFDSPSDDEVLGPLIAGRPDRARSRSRVQAALRDFDEASIFTIHGLCQRILTNHAFESGTSFDTELVTNHDTLLTEVVSDYWATSLYGATPAWVRHVIEAGITPESLIALASIGVADPEMPILPEPAAERSIAAAEADLDIARKAAAAIWARESARVMAVLGTLSGTHYRKTSLPNWEESMNTALAPEAEGGVAWFKQFHRFTTGGVAEGTKKGQAVPTHPFFAACTELGTKSQALVRVVEDRMLAFRRDLITFARREVPRRKEAVRTQGFDDLLHRLDAALRGPNGAVLAEAIRAKYKVALIDEFQDTDPVQYRIFHAIYPTEASTGMFLIGDPKQAIYSFRGADVFAYLRAVRDAEGRRYTLDTNYRSDPGLVTAVNSIFARAQKPFLFDEIAFVEAKAKPGATERLHHAGMGEGAASSLRLLFVRRLAEATKPITKGWADRHLPGAVAADIARLLSSGATLEGRPISAGDIAVLVRKNRQANAVQEALRDLRVPAVLQGDASVFDAPEALEVQHVMAAMAAPSHAGTVRLALITSLFGLDAGEIHALEDDDAGWDRWSAQFRAWGQRWEGHGFIGAFRQLLDQQSAPQRLLRFVDGERRLTNVLHLAELLHVAATREHLGPTGLLRWLSTMRRDQGARDRFGSEAAQMRLESDDRAVKLVTIHKSKGLQYPIVYCPFLWDGKLLGKDADEALRFHDPKNDDRHTLDLGSPDIEEHMRHAQREAAAENLRLLYVALTRAKHQTAVVWGNFNDASTSPLGYLLHQSPGAKGDLFESTDARVKGLDDDTMMSELRALANASGGAIGVEALSFAAAPPYTPPPGRGEELHCRAVTRGIDRLWRTSSFSALTSAASAMAARDAEGRDRDAREARSAVDTSPGEPTGPLEGADSLIPLHGFPRGAQPGELVHKVFELVDFAGSEADVAACVTRQLDRFRFPTAEWAEVLTGAVRAVLATPLCMPGTPGAPAEAAFMLQHVPWSKRLCELEFVLPVDAFAGVGDGKRQLLTRKTLADVFALHAHPLVPADYAEELRRLPFAPLEGFLRGVIDLVAEHEGQFYVVDYKSNFLGPKPADYGPQALGPAMRHQHYILQYHLYTVAVHRYLTYRVKGYDYDKHFGGVFYLFLRGMAPERAMTTGVFADKPPRALIEALSDLFAGQQATP